MHGPWAATGHTSFGQALRCFSVGACHACRRGRFRRLLGLSKGRAGRMGPWRPHCSNTDRYTGALDDRRARRLGNGCPSGTLCAPAVRTPNIRSEQLAACKPSPCVGLRLTFASPLSFSVAGLGSAPLPVPLSGRILRMAKAAVDLRSFTWRHLFRFAKRLIVVGIRSVPRSSLGKRALRHIACSACRAMNSNTLVGLVLKNPEIHAQPPLSPPCQNDAKQEQER
jgi:hypothetical protein